MFNLVMYKLNMYKLMRIQRFSDLPLPLDETSLPEPYPKDSLDSNTLSPHSGMEDRASLNLQLNNLDGLLTQHYELNGNLPCGMYD